MQTLGLVIFWTLAVAVFASLAIQGYCLTAAILEDREKRKKKGNLRLNRADPGRIFVYANKRISPSPGAVATSFRRRRHREHG